MSPAGLAGAFGGGAMFGGLHYSPWVSNEPWLGGGEWKVVHHRHKKQRDEGPADDKADNKKIDCDALADPEHTDHREAVTTIAHVDDTVHESILTKIKEALERL
jgi:hypothetical protein